MFLGNPNKTTTQKIHPTQTSDALAKIWYCLGVSMDTTKITSATPLYLYPFILYLYKLAVALNHDMLASTVILRGSPIYIVPAVHCNHSYHVCLQSC